MIKVVDAKTLELRPGGTVKFEGAPNGATVSFFHTKNAPGGGAQLHVHPYEETWLVIAGRVRFGVGDEEYETEAGHVVVAPANVPHKFTNIGDHELQMVCIHPAASMQQQDLE